MALTEAQLQAVKARGNVLVVAGAGTGKTSTLVHRCLDLLLTEGCSITELLLVTFTEAAAAEMRGRVRAELQARIHSELDVANAAHLRQQLALLDTAHIGTLHSFCLKLARQHFYALGLDPSVAVLDEKQTAPLATKALDKIFQHHYAGDTEEDITTCELIDHLGQGLDEKARQLVRKLHSYTQSLEDPAGWLARQEQLFRQDEPDSWREWFLAAFPGWRAQWRAALAPHAEVPAIAQCLREMNAGDGVRTCSEVAALLAGLQRALDDKDNWPKGTKTPVKSRLARFWSDIDFLHAALVVEDGSDPLAQDWHWVRQHLCALLRLTREFGVVFSREKRDQGGVDFADLEQCALRVLRDPATGELTAIARQWQQRLRFIFVDEYQDINPAQDAILAALSREKSEPNRFLVGDVKQSIYRFRRANPKIFRAYEAGWRQEAGAGRRIPLAENFRSREAILAFLNPLFAALMRPSLGGVDYPEDAQLRFGAPAERRHLSLAAAPVAAGEPVAPRVELRLIDEDDDSGESDAESEDRSEAQAVLLDLLSIEREARLVAGRLRELREKKHLVWDLEEQVFRSVEWSDMVVLLRSPASRAEAFAQEFNRQGVPLSAARAGFFNSLEIADLVNLLKLMDNPLQDLPLLAVLRSPLVALSLDELVEIRARSSAKPFWLALRVFAAGETELSAPSGDPGAGNLSSVAPAKAGTPCQNLLPLGEGQAAMSQPAAPPPEAETGRKVNLFLRQYERWRELARQYSLSECLEAVLVETHYEALLQAEPRGDERVANVRRLLTLAREYDPYQRQGLYRFLRFVKMQEEEELEQEPAAAQTENAVRLMSIHKAKGLEFPVVVLAGLGVRFNFQDLSREIMLHEQYGLCPRVKPPDADQAYSSIIHWLAREEERREQMGEELRLLYVALTRARDTLILTGTGRGPRWQSAERPCLAENRIADHDLMRARSYLDWLLLWLPQVTTAQDWQDDRAGENPLLRWRLYAANDPRLLGPETEDEAAPGTETAAEELDPIGLLKLQERILWQYPLAAAAREPAIKRISELIRHPAAGEETQSLFPDSPSFSVQPARRPARSNSKLAAVDAGSAHHRFLELVSLDRVGTLKELKAEAELLLAGGLLSGPEVEALDFKSLLAFWESETGRRILGHQPWLHREIPFTARFTPEDLAALGLCPNAGALRGEYFVARGKADLAVILPTEIWLLDFKTDHVREAVLADTIRRYSCQLKLYALGLSRIYRRPVTERWLHFLSLRHTVSV